MTKSPCYTNGTDCPRRRVGCREKCEAWQKWTEIHEAEKAAVRRKKDERIVVSEYAQTTMDRIWKRAGTKKRIGQK